MCFRAGNLTWLLLMGTGWIFSLAILGMSFKVPSYAQTKAFYGLPALLAFCAAFALGFDYWMGRGRMTRFVVAVALGVWLLNVYASFWIRPHAVQTELACALSASVFAKEDSSGNVFEDFAGASGRQRNDRVAGIGRRQKNPQLAVEQLQQALKHDANNVQLETELSWDLGLCGKADEGIAHAKRAVELAPENVVAAQMWRALAMRQTNRAEVIPAARDVLSLEPAYLESRFDLGMALMNTGHSAEAISEFFPHS